MARARRVEVYARVHGAKGKLLQVKRTRTLVVLACVAPLGIVGTSAHADTSSVSTTTTSLAPAYVAPLTGLPDPRHLTKNRAALTVKIDNTPAAMPQAGVQDADVVYEEIVEGGITRLAAIFDSRLPTVVGPVRSVRRTDREIVFPIGGIFAFSGGAEYAVRSIKTAPVVLFDQSNSGAAMYRDLKRYSPHNLFANAVLLERAKAKPRPTPPLFSYLTPGDHPLGPKVRSFVVGFNAGFAASYAWNAKTASWDRSLFGHLDVTTNGTVISPKNVLVMSVNYVGGVGVIDSYAQMVGSGSLELFTGGHLERGTWFRHHLGQATTFLTTRGYRLRLTPGSTWVELLDTSEHVTVTTRP
jgi:hypothetical protein